MRRLFIPVVGNMLEGCDISALKNIKIQIVNMRPVRIHQTSELSKFIVIFYLGRYSFLVDSILILSYREIYLPECCRICTWNLLPLEKYFIFISGIIS